MGIQAEHLDAHSEDEDRSDVLERFRSGETKVLCNVGLYTEGTDIPEIECIVLARPTKSLGFHLQMIGRGARPYEGKKDFMVLDHGGNVERLGFYEEEVEWSLNGKELGYKKKREYKKEKKPFTCEMCSCVHTGKRCPECGWEVKDYGKKIEAIEAELVELGKNKKPKATMEDKRRFLGMLDYERKQRGYKKGWADHKYKEHFGVWPRCMDDVCPIEPDETFKNWLIYQRIKYFKSKKRLDNNIPVVYEQDERIAV
jgi:superfamily II DNA or RNA helicase